ncbi:MAG: alpha-glucan family phosphorylase [Verrucomicrobia bacterium]|nr:alpha-glucan family phosphorylase [Verrucomicrobiota bacterium]
MNDRTIAYFSMEIALDPAMPTYSGGLGVLAGDTIRSAAELKVPMVAVSLLHRKGYLSQRLDASGWQHEEPTEWPVEKFLQELPQRAQVTIQRRPVHVRAWKFEVKGFRDFTVPVFLLDTDLPENSEWDRTLTHYLYGGDRLYRLCQEVVLGIGGARMLSALGFQHLAHFHMNEGHAALLTLELLAEQSKRAGRDCVNHEDIDAVRRMCIFTTHTPVPAGHDQFPMDLVANVLGHRADFMDMKDLFCVNLVNDVFGQRGQFSDFKDVLQSGNTLNMTYLALNLSHYVNGVAKKHGEVSRHLFAGYEIDAITNGVHAATWVSPTFQELFDHHIPGWRQDNFSLRFAHGLGREEIWQAHVGAKQRLLEFVSHATDGNLDPAALTLGFARRATRYKRGDLLVRDLGRLRDIAAKAGKLQVIYAGKAHPNDSEGKEFIQRIVQVRDALKPAIPIVYLENYDMEMAKLLTAGVDVWLNTPQPPLEASGTSGMKAALNGVPSLSILDGWWIEGWIEGQTGWAIGEHCDKGPNDTERSGCDAASLYDKLERVILPLFHQNCDGFIDVMRHCISLNGSFFNTQRMVQQYVVKAYMG